MALPAAQTTSCSSGLTYATGWHLYYILDDILGRANELIELPELLT